MPLWCLMRATPPSWMFCTARRLWAGYELGTLRFVSLPKISFIKSLSHLVILKFTKKYSFMITKLMYKWLKQEMHNNGIRYMTVWSVSVVYKKKIIHYVFKSIFLLERYCQICRWSNFAVYGLLYMFYKHCLTFCRRYEVNDLPDSEEDLSEWLRNLFKEKVIYSF